MIFKRAISLGWLVTLVWWARVTAAAPPFPVGVEDLRAGHFSEAAREVRVSLEAQPAAGTLLNLGLVEWRQGRVGPAILSWEQSAWLNPLDAAAHQNLLFARQAAQLEPPELTWYEITSAWLPADVWAWIASVSLWLTVAIMMVPRVLRRPKTGWHQSLAAFGLGVCLLSLPPNVGVVTRASLGIVLEKKAPLRLTPTKEGEMVSSLVAGEWVRKLRDRGDYCFVRTPRGTGWVERQQLGLIGRASD